MDKKTTKKQKTPKGTKRNPWWMSREGGVTRYFRITSHGIWMVSKLPKGAILNQD